ncbi:MAG: hypothetical protein FWD24_02340 [Treponema sp.]|nr:hypothetical protein [Treponema sp.]
MRKKIKIIIFMIFVIILAGCGEKYPLNGKWNGNLDGDAVSIIFVDNICFLKDDYEIRKGTFNFDNDSGTFNFRDNYLITFSVNGNEMILNNYIELFTFVKERNRKPAPSAIHGVWEGPDGWVLAFINDTVYVIDNDGDVTHGVFNFNLNTGSFKCEYWYEVNFSVKKNTLEAKIDTNWETEENISFTRVEQ